MIRVFGLDTSLSNTGIAEFNQDSEEPWLSYAETPKPITDDVEGNAERIAYAASKIFRAVTTRVQPGDDVWVIFEGPSMHSKYGKPDERAGLRWHLVIAFRRQGYRIVVVPPSVVKLFWAFNGNAAKPTMLGWAARRYPGLYIRDHNVADALALASTGASHRGLIPTPRPPLTNIAALAGVVWPAPQQEA